MREIGVRVSDWWAGLSWGEFAVVVVALWGVLFAGVGLAEFSRRLGARRAVERRRATVERVTRVIVVQDVSRV
jgi:hypothetical protein